MAVGGGGGIWSGVTGARLASVDRRHAAPSDAAWVVDEALQAGPVTGVPPASSRERVLRPLSLFQRPLHLSAGTALTSGHKAELRGLGASQLSSPLPVRLSSHRTGTAAGPVFDIDTLPSCLPPPRP